MLKNKKNKDNIINIIKNLLIILLTIILLINLKNDYKEYMIFKENNEKINEIEAKIIKEYEYYDEIKNNYKTNIDKPYIPIGFEYVEGTYENGYVIEDEFENQYVWVPCSKEQNILKKTNYTNTPFISYYECYEEEYEEFINSVLENGGFYISRYEIGKENDIPVSKKDIKIWNNINLEEAKQIVNNMYENENFKCEIINGFAYDTTLNWILNDGDINIKKENIGKKSEYTGRNSYKNIYDILDENMEITLEKSYSNTIIYRGFISDEMGVKKQLGIEITDNRWITEEESKIENFGIRTIIYK